MFTTDITLILDSRTGLHSHVQAPSQINRTGNILQFDRAWAASTMTSAVVRAYRGLLREFWKSSIFHRPARNPVIHSSLRKSLAVRIPNEEETSIDVLKDVNNTTAFLRADRHFKTLLGRYSPLHDLSEEERIKATARRVGLNTPMEYKQ